MKDWLKRNGLTILIAAVLGGLIVYTARYWDRPIPLAEDAEIAAIAPRPASKMMMARTMQAPAQDMAMGAAATTSPGFVSGGGEIQSFSPAPRRTIAYTHSITVEVKNRDAMKASMDDIVKSCQSGDYDCELLNAQITSDKEYPSASISVRLLPDGIPAMKELAARNGDMASESTYSEQLGEQITDVERRLATQEDYLKRLQELSLQKGDLDDTLRVQREMSNVISQIEAMKTQQRQIQKRVEREVLNISYQMPPPPTATSAPLQRAIEQFGRTIGRSTAGMITALGALLPWLIVLGLIGYIARGVITRRWGFRK